MGSPKKKKKDLLWDELLPFLLPEGSLLPGGRSDQVWGRPRAPFMTVMTGIEKSKGHLLEVIFHAKHSMFPVIQKASVYTYTHTLVGFRA